MSIAANLIIWTFFVLISTKFLEFFALVHGSPIRPFQVYAALISAAAIVIVLHLRKRASTERPTASEIAVFVTLAILALWNLASFGGHPEGWTRIALWPIANLLMGAELFYFARMMNLGPTIFRATAAALVVQLASITIDLWLPGTFAEWAPRPAGLPQNSNDGALLTCLLMAMLLPARLRERPSSAPLYALITGFPLVFATLSRSGLILYFVVLLIYAAALFFAPPDKIDEKNGNRLLFAAFLSCFVATFLFAPTLRLPETISMWRDRIGFAIPDLAPKFATTTSAKIAKDVTSLQASTLTPRDDAIRRSDGESQGVIDMAIQKSDDTIQQRLAAALFFWNEGLSHPIVGQGTGYGYLFKTGPHNTFLDLLAEDGVPAVVLYLTALALVTAIAIRRKSPALLAMVGIGWVNSMLSHTVLVEPFLLVFSGAMIGCSLSNRPSAT